MAPTLKNQGLYEARREHDGCGVGAVVNISGKRDHSIIEYSKEILLNLRHRGATGADEITGDGAGIAPKGNSIRLSAISTFQIIDGKLAEAWEIYDSGSMAQQMQA